MPAVQYSSEALVQTEDLSSMSVEELQAELIRTRQAFHSAGCARSVLCFCVCYLFASRLLSLCVLCGPPYWCNDEHTLAAVFLQLLSDVVMDGRAEGWV